jgi:glycosyltransferase involved in cell wall biosynthesis
MPSRHPPQRILLASHSPVCTTGYGRVTRRLAHAFREAGHAVAAAGVGYGGGPHDLPYRLVPWLEKRPAESLAAALRELSPDVLLTIGDPWMFDFLPGLAERQGVKWVAYFPVDGRPLPREWKRWVEAVDVPVVFCRFTQDLMAKALGRAPELIYHGVDTDRFVPQDKQKAKESAHVAGHFVVGTVARNQQRKNLPALLRAFAAFAKGKQDVLLYLHTQVRGEWDLAELSRELGIEGKTRVTAKLGGGSGVPDALLATVYNAMDLFVLPTMAEGFGLPIVEAQACGVPALVTDYSACPELVP